MTFMQTVIFLSKFVTLTRFDTFILPCDPVLVCTGIKREEHVSVEAGKERGK